MFRAYVPLFWTGDGSQAGLATTCTVEYTVTQENVDNGAVINVATATGDPPGDDIPPPTDDEEIIPNDPQPRILIDKVTEVVTDLVVGDVIDYEYIVTNVGDVRLTDVSVDDPKIPNVSRPTDELAPGESMTCTGSYTVTSSEALQGEVVNHASVTGDPPGDGPPVEDDDEETVTDDDDPGPGPGPGPGPDPDDPVPGIDIDKIAEVVDELVEGDVIDFAFIITNTGDVVLTDISVDDPLIPGGVTCPLTELDPGEMMSCAGSYTVTEADVENGQIVNHATVTGDPPGDDPPVDDDDTETVDPGDDPGDDPDDDGKDADDDDPTYPQLPPDTGLTVESAAGSQDSSAQILFMLTVFGMWMLAAGLAINTWRRRRSMP